MIIEKLALHTANAVSLMPFYAEMLGLPVVSSEQGRFTVQAGWSELTFLELEQPPNEKHYYHFAFTIPENKLAEAKRWIEELVPIGTEAGQDISYSESWDSHSVYFEDPAGNILELIARHTMNNATDDSFDPKQHILCISEIGVPTGKVPSAVDQLAALGLMTYKTRNESFNPVGDDNGLMMVVETGRRWHFTDKTAECFPVRVTVQGVGELYLSENEHGLLIQNID
ncbi:catechol 2,3-dioxygenase-like lactoylglutathione lyase family enzyme [Paenibacillus endophyticus]|uniref:Catechol 2,3-dioxygenase-like lactoylglutathione lyase family enzyme n=1 Tax=Paenibacillus endophyticus TaxID=1294268 RepID=A0A7W5GB72_9BACL|nr:VOC family protein [Paenibacillus endophyticus]MBB3152667.1 catechol 2,3-dioxygenase-like lactoylglutathione lyase family enzyme [Paenibacillus endophyticus]